MEFTEEFVKIFEGIGTLNKSVPVSARFKRTIVLFVISDNLRVIPRECENITMLLLVEMRIYSKLLVSRFKVNFGCFCLS